MQRDKTCNPVIGERLKRIDLLIVSFIDIECLVSLGKVVTMTGSKIFLFSVFFLGHLTAKTFLIEDQYGNNKPCRCSKLLRPVCGVNGETYSNSCLARCAGIRQGSLRKSDGGFNLPEIKKSVSPS